MADIRIGTAGWSIAGRHAGAFPGEGSALTRYAARFNAAEINSCFYRSHRAATYEKWAASVPGDFRFSVKLSKAATHERRLADCADMIEHFLDETAALGPKRGVILVQLPPSLAFDDALAGRFFEELAARTSDPVACEPRHASWFEAKAETMLVRFRIARVAADPERVEGAGKPGGWPGLAYYRLHGSPAIYRTSYDDGRLEAYAARIAVDAAGGREAWCIFDNTMSAAATSDGLRLGRLLDMVSEPAPRGGV